MKKIDFKPLLMTLPFVLCIVILLIIDRPQTELAVKDNDPSTSNIIQSEIDNNKEPGKKEDASNEDEVPINPIDNPVERDIPKDALKLSLAIGRAGSLQIGGGDIIYEEPDEESTQLAQLQYHCAVLLHEEQTEEDWIHVKLIGEYSEGYVKKESAYLIDIEVGDNDPVRNKIVKDAISYIGLRFKRYGKSLEDGIDCSNFVERIYKKNGIEIPDTPIGIKDAGEIIPDREAKPGDIVFYDKANNGTGHVGIYLGDGLIIHSSGHSGKTYPEGGVRISCLLYPDRDSYMMINILGKNREKE